MTIEHDLQLRLLVQSHGQELYRLVDSNRSHLKRWLSFVDDYQSVDTALEFIARFREMRERDSGVAIGVWFSERMVGVVTYDYIDWNNRATRLGYWLGKSSERQGIMTRTCKALTNLAFNKIGLNRVEIWCASSNTRCRRVPERLGYKQEGVFRQRELVADKFLDMVSYSILAGEWKNWTSEN